MGAHDGVQARLSGRHQGRRRGRVPDVYTQLRSGGRRHPAGPDRAREGRGEARRGSPMKWTDSEDIGIGLYEKYPDVDPLTVRFTDLRERVLQLDGVDDDPKTSN